ncbi:MAG: IgGFc-binding protein [Polyangiaceae bacterium]|nr:IgGFc-binding protein [Polyangiaceae bacterium]
MHRFYLSSFPRFIFGATASLCSLVACSGTRLTADEKQAQSETAIEVNDLEPGVVNEQGDGFLSIEDQSSGPPNNDVSAGDSENPATCEIAAEQKSYIGCSFWPTVTYNKVFEEFDFTVVVFNGGVEDAELQFTGGALAETLVEVVPAGELKVVSLPWVPELKGTEWNSSNTFGDRVYESVRKDRGAYHLETSFPVTVWQFNPLQYEKPEADVAGCHTNFNPGSCFSVSNDASLLIPDTALTGNYRVPGWGGEENTIYSGAASGFAVTATEDNMTVRLQYGPRCEATSRWNEDGMCTQGGGGLSPQPPSGQDEFTLNAGDVMQVMGAFTSEAAGSHGDLSGTQVQADKTVQVLALNPIANIPDLLTGNADHLEESVLPAEALGKRYIVAPPTAPTGQIEGGHVVRLIGNIDGTELVWSGDRPADAPDSLNAGEFWVSGVVDKSFSVEGSASFSLASYMLGGGKQGGSECLDIGTYPCLGDPAMSMVVTPEQFRTQYSFLAPTDYVKNFADILLPDGANVTLNGATISATEAVIEGWSVARVPLEGDGAYRIESDQPVGLQVMGYGHATSYYYPGGLNLKLISEPPPEIVIVR